MDIDKSEIKVSESCFLCKQQQNFSWLHPKRLVTKGNRLIFLATESSVDLYSQEHQLQLTNKGNIRSGNNKREIWMRAQTGRPISKVKYYP